MEYTSEFDAGTGICRIHVTGDYQRARDSETFKRFIGEQLAGTACWRYLFDMRDAQMQSSTVASYEAANPAPEVKAMLFNVRTAVLLARITQDDQFFENVAVNRGLPLRVFTDESQAREWLTTP